MNVALFLGFFFFFLSISFGERSHVFVCYKAVHRCRGAAKLFFFFGGGGWEGYRVSCLGEYCAIENPRNMSLIFLERKHTHTKKREMFLCCLRTLSLDLIQRLVASAFPKSVVSFSEVFLTPQVSPPISVSLLQSNKNKVLTWWPNETKSPFWTCYLTFSIFVSLVSLSNVNLE